MDRVRPKESRISAQSEASILNYELKSITVLRYLTLVSMAGYTVYFFAPYLYETFYREEIIEVLFSSPTPPVFVLPQSFAYTLFSVHIIAYLMILMKFSISAKLFLAAIAADILVILLSGMVTYTVLDRLVLTIVNMCDGALLFLLFYVKVLDSTESIESK